MSTHGSSLVRFGRILLGIVAAAAMIGNAAASPGGSSGSSGGKVSAAARKLADTKGGDRVELILTYASNPSDADRKAVKDNQGTIRREFKAIRGHAISVPASAIEGLSNNPNVAWITVDGAVEPAMNLVQRIVGAQPPSASDPSATGLYQAVDNFGDGTYSGSAGSMPWLGPWQEADLTATGPASGPIKIVSGELRLSDYPDTKGRPYVKRCVDLSAAKTATLKFNYRTSSAVPKDRIGLYASSSSTGSMTLLITYSGGASGSASYDLTPYRSSNTCVAFYVDSDYGSSSKYFAVGDLTIDVVLPTGAGVGVAVLDSGWSYHYDLGTSAVPVRVDMLGGDGSDPYGHGTHVQGIIASRGSTLPTFHGMAPGASIVSVRVLDRYGSGRTSDVIAGIDWVIANNAANGIRIMNLSLGHPVYEPAANDPLVQAVERAWDAGIVVVCSAGNRGVDGNATISSPGNSPKVITVGSMTDWNTEDKADDTVSSYSSRGPTLGDRFAKPDLLAPGNRITEIENVSTDLYSLFPDLRKYVGNFNDYLELSGTSMSAAVVSGTAAMMLERDPSLSPATVKARLMLSARKPNAGNPFATGAGMVDAVAALKATGTATAACSGS